MENVNDIYLLCTCGHVVTASIGSAAHAPTAQQATRRPPRTYHSHAACPRCLPQERTAHRRALCQLTGQPYQVALANDIRKAHMARFAQLVTAQPFGIADDMLEAMIALVNHRTPSAWWIRHAENTFQPLIPDCDARIRKVVIAAAYGTGARSHAASAR